MYIVLIMFEFLYKESRLIENKVKIILLGVKWEVEVKEKIKNIFFYVKRYEFYGVLELSFVIVLVDVESERRLNLVGKFCYNV